jgi:hypothetical protein
MNRAFADSTDVPQLGQVRVSMSVGGGVEQEISSAWEQETAAG